MNKCKLSSILLLAVSAMSASSDGEIGVSLGYDNLLRSRIIDLKERSQSFEKFLELTLGCRNLHDLTTIELSSIVDDSNWHLLDREDSELYDLQENSDRDGYMSKIDTMRKKQRHFNEYLMEKIEDLPLELLATKNLANLADINNYYDWLRLKSLERESDSFLRRSIRWVFDQFESSPNSAEISRLASQTVGKQIRDGNLELIEETMRESRRTEIERIQKLIKEAEDCRRKLKENKQNYGDEYFKLMREKYDYILKLKKELMGLGCGYKNI